MKVSLRQVVSNAGASQTNEGERSDSEGEKSTLLPHHALRGESESVVWKVSSPSTRI